MKVNNELSIIVPTLNESGNIVELIRRVSEPLTRKQIKHEIIIVDDNSSDDTAILASKMAPKYPVQVIKKTKQTGKAQSLLIGFKFATHDLVSMIDADLQYPPEEIATMHALLVDNNADVVITRRHSSNIPLTRRVTTKVFNLIFTRLLFGIKFDTQSGLKLFRKRVIQSFDMHPSPWSFDLEFIIRSLEHSYTILEHDISFNERHAGETKVKLLSTAKELAVASVRLRLATSIQKLKSGHKRNKIFTKYTLTSFLIVSIAVAAIGIHQAHKQPKTLKTHATILNSDETNSLLNSLTVDEDLNTVVGNILQPDTTNTPATPTAPTSTPTTQNAEAPASTEQVRSNTQSNSGGQGDQQSTAVADSRRSIAQISQQDFDTQEPTSSSDPITVLDEHSGTDKRSSASNLQDIQSIYASTQNTFNPALIMNYRRIAQLSILLGVTMSAMVMASYIQKQYHLFLITNHSESR